MATKVRVEMNSPGFRALLRSQPVLDDLQRRAQAIAGAAGEGFEVDARVGSNRARASVRTASFEARKAEAEDKVLTSSIDAGRS